MNDKRTTEKTAMECFRAMLKKRGIEFDTNDDECAEGEERITVFKANLGESESDIFVTAKDWYFDGKLTPWLDVEFHNTLTPEQAIAATLGRGTCERTCKPIIELWESDKTKYDAYCCNCDYPLGDGKLMPWNYCPNCGCKVVER